MVTVLGTPAALGPLLEAVTWQLLRRMTRGVLIAGEVRRSTPGGSGPNPSETLRTNSHRCPSPTTAPTKAFRRET